MATRAGRIRLKPFLAAALLAVSAMATAADQADGYAIQAILNEPAVRDKVESQGDRIAPMRTPAEFDEWLAREYEKYSAIVKEAGMLVD